MPRYRFTCESCGQVTEVSRGMTEEKTPERCSHCGGIKLRRVFSSPAMSVKRASSGERNVCCGRDEPCNAPPCSDSGVCQRY